MSGKDYSYRKGRLEKRILALASCYAVEINAYAVMSNHFHLQIYYDPKASERWSDDEVALRWFETHPPCGAMCGENLEILKERARKELCSDRERVEHCRKHLGSLSCYMQHLKQPFAASANKEDCVKGYFFDQRFYSGALLDEKAVIACMAYVDLNPVRAKLAKNIGLISHTSIDIRMKEASVRAEVLDAFMQPIVSGLRSRLGASRRRERTRASQYVLTLREYLGTLHEVAAEDLESAGSSAGNSLANSLSLAKRKRAYGTPEQIENWKKRRCWERPSRSPTA